VLLLGDLAQSLWGLTISQTHDSYNHSTNTRIFSIHLGSHIDDYGEESLRGCWKSLVEGTKSRASFPECDRVLLIGKRSASSNRPRKLLFTPSKLPDYCNTVNDAVWSGILLSRGQFPSTWAFLVQLMAVPGPYARRPDPIDWHITHANRFILHFGNRAESYAMEDLAQNLKGCCMLEYLNVSSFDDH
jgi:hypothetical protein